MPYTRVWTKVNPPGSQAANTADDELRNLREDIEQRITSLVTGWDTAVPTDPIVVKPEILGNVTGKTILLHSSAFDQIEAANTAWTGTDSTAIKSTAAQVLRAPLVIPVGVTVTLLEVMINWGAGGAHTCKLRYQDFAGGALVVTDVAAISITSGAATAIYASGALTHVVLANKMYFIEMTLGVPAVAAFFNGVRVTYNTPDTRNTL